MQRPPPERCANRVADAFRQQTAKMPATTEAERLVVQRVGQNLFRQALLDFWHGQCAVTGLAVPELLRASHIKPWAQCATDNERLECVQRPAAGSTHRCAV